ncbi:recombinase RecT [Sphingomonas sp.]|uniref:recombinase RecT n=1 Tax=Sphingomonas sp. TaxID=28214 RepID=UPI003B3B7E14
MATALANIDETRAAVTSLSNQLATRAEQFKMALPAHIKPDQFQRTIITAVQSDPELLRADRQSLLLACMKAAQDGLLPDKREAALVIFKENKKDAAGQWVSRLLVQYMPMVYGLRKKILQSREVTDIKAAVVYRREVAEGFFIYEEGTESVLRHKPMLDLTEEDATDSNIVAAYSMATYKDGSKSYEVMRRFEVDKVREKSQTGATRDKRGNPRTPSGPWVEWYPEQAKKTVMRRHSKTLPMSGDLIDVEARDDAIYAASTANVLSATEVAPPTVLPSRTDTPHDPDTGEVLDEETQQQLDRESLRQMDGGADDEGGKPDEERGEANEGAADRIIDEINLRTTVPDINSYMSGQGHTLAALSDEDRNRVAEAQTARVELIKAGKAE